MKRILQFFPPPIFPDDEERTRDARILSTVSVSVFLAVLAYSFFAPAERYLHAGAAFATILLTWLTMKRGFIYAAKIVMVAGFSVVILSISFGTGGVRAPEFAAFVVVIAFSGLLLGRKAALGMTLVCVASGAAFFMLDSLGLLPQPLAYTDAVYWAVTTIVFLLTGTMLASALQIRDAALQRVQSELAERKRVQDEYFALFDNSPIGIYRSSVDGRMIRANWALTRFNGYDDKEEFLKNVTDIAAEWYVDPQRRQVFQRELEENGRVTNFESEVFRHKTRERVWISENARVVRDSNGVILYYEGTVEDITLRKRAEISLKQRESILESITFAAERLIKSSDWRVMVNPILTQLGQSIHASHAYLIEHFSQPDETEMAVMRYEWTAPGQAEFIHNPIYAEPYPLRVEAGTTNEFLVRGEAFVGRSSTFPLKDKARLDAVGIKALLEVPLFVNNRWWGTIGFDDFEHEREWLPPEIDTLKIAAGILSAAIKRQLDEAALQSELNERRHVETNLRQRESILEVVADAANRLLKSSDWKSEINLILESLGETINASHAYLFENHLDTEATPVTSMKYEWTAPELPATLEQENFQNVPLKEPGFETWFETLSAGLPYLGDQQHAPSEEMRGVHARGMKAMLDVPIHVNGEWWGTIGFDDTINLRIWSNAEVDALLVAGNILGNAIERQRVDQLLQEELAQRKQLIAELAAKNAELERFTYTVSHDLKAPLFTIRGFLGYLEQDFLKGNMDRFQQDAQRIADAAEKMQELLNDLLELSRVGRLLNEPEEVPMNEVVREALEIVQGQIEKGKVSVLVQENLPRVNIDRQRIVEVYQNLIDNAVKFAGGQPNPRLEIGQAGEEAGMPILYVRDNGIGIADEHHERVFGLFNKLDPKSEGTGIGLALVRRIVEFHGGRIWVESEVGKGSTFYLTLPRTRSAVPSHEADGKSDRAQGKSDSVI